MRNIFGLLVLFSTGQGSSNTFQEILDRARQRTLSETSLKRSGSYTADHDDLIRDVVTSFSETETLSNLHKVFQTLLTHLGMDSMSEGSFYNRAITLRRQLGLTPLGPSEPSSESPDFCIIENYPKCSEPDKRRKLDTDLSFASSVRDDEDIVRQETRESPENQDAMLTLSSEDLAIPPEHDCNLLNERLNNEGIYGMLLGRARQRMETQPPASWRRFKKYTLAHDELMLDVVNSFKSESVSRQYEIFNQLTSDLGMVRMEWKTFSGRAAQARKQTGDPAKIKTRKPKIGLEASNLLESFLHENPKISTKDAWKALESKLLVLHHADAPIPSLSQVTNRLQYNRRSRRFDDIQQLNMEGSIANGAAEEEEAWVMKEQLEGSSSDTTQTKPQMYQLKEVFKKNNVQADDLIIAVVKSSKGEFLSRQYELFKKLSQDVGLNVMSRSKFINRASVARGELFGYPQRRSARVPAIGLANSELLDSLFKQDPKISEGAAMKALESVPRDTHDDSPLPSIAQVRSWLVYRRNVRRFVAKNGLGSRNQDDADFFREVSLAKGDEAEAETLAVPSNSAISRRKEDREDDADFFREISLALADEVEAETPPVPSNSAVLRTEEDREDNADYSWEFNLSPAIREEGDIGPSSSAPSRIESVDDIWKEISFFLSEVRNEENNNPSIKH